MNKVLIVHTSWYEDYISTMVDTSIKSLEKDFKYDIIEAECDLENSNTSSIKQDIQASLLSKIDKFIKI